VNRFAAPRPTTEPATTGEFAMKAIVIDRHGSPHVLELGDIDPPAGS
jgi:hypothetical protein